MGKGAGGKGTGGRDAGKGAGKGKGAPIDAKERVKNQRLKGQTLGGTTTHWKSDAEMVLRQQYD